MASLSGMGRARPKDSSKGPHQTVSVLGQMLQLSPEAGTLVTLSPPLPSPVHPTRESQGPFPILSPTLSNQSRLTLKSTSPYLSFQGTINPEENALMNFFLSRVGACLVISRLPPLGSQKFCPCTLDPSRYSGASRLLPGGHKALKNVILYVHLWFFCPTLKDRKSRV